MRVPVDVTDEQGDGVEPWVMELEPAFRPFADANIVVDTFSRSEFCQNYQNSN